MDRTIEDFVRGLALDAYLVGGAVRDELLGLESKDADFVVPASTTRVSGARSSRTGGSRTSRSPDGSVGARLYPHDKNVRAVAPAGIEFAPPRAERSTGPGRHDFEIVADPGLSIEDDMARRDFTVNAIARRLETGELVDPFGGAADLERGVLRTVGPRSFAEDPLRLVRGLRLVSQLGLTPDEPTLQQMRDEADSVRLVSGERVGGGLHADGMGELSKLLLGTDPARALRLARDTGVLTALLPELEPAIGFEQSSKRQHLPLDEHIFEVVQAAADAGAPLAVRLGALLHDAGKPGAERRTTPSAVRSSRTRLSTRLRYPSRLRTYVTRLVRAHAFPLDRRRRALRTPLPARARRRARVRPRRAQGGRPAREAGPAGRARRGGKAARVCSSRSARSRTGSRTSPSTGATCSSSATRGAGSSAVRSTPCSTRWSTIRH